MISCALFIRIYRIRHRLAFGYVVILFICFLFVVRIKYFSSVDDDENSDESRVAAWRRVSSHEACHMSRDGDALTLLPSNVTLPENSIFFHETTCKGDLSPRQACAVESAAKAHPNHQINVFFTSAVKKETLNSGSVSTLINNYKNVKLARVLIEDYAKETPLALKIAQMRSEDLNIQISKVMKYLTLYKYSGIHLSLDVIVARQFDLLPNWVVKDSPNTLSTDLFAFSKNKAGRKLAEYALSFLLTELRVLRHDLWSYSQPSVITNLLSSWCSVTAVADMDLSHCNNLAVYGRELFYPVSFHDRKQYFQVVDWENWKKQLIYTYVVWHRFTKYNLVTPGSLYGKISSEYCPMIYHRFSDISGVWYPEDNTVWD